MKDITLWHGECLEEMKKIEDGSIDMILCDLPYGTTSCKWDSIIPFEPLWEQYERIIKKNGAIVLFGSQPFTSSLIMSNLKLFKHSYVWVKNHKTGHLNAKIKPMKRHEDIIVFGNKRRYYPQGLVKFNKKVKNSKSDQKRGKHNRTSTVSGGVKEEYYQKYTNYPDDVLHFDSMNGNKMHPTQKPVALLEYLIKTYTQENETVLDNCMGSGSTGIACLNSNRKFIGIEQDENYFNKAKERIENHK